MGQPSSKKNEMTIRHQFDRFCQKILHDEKVDYIREQEYRKQHEITLNEIPKKELDKVHGSTVSIYKRTPHQYRYIQRAIE